MLYGKTPSFLGVLLKIMGIESDSRTATIYHIFGKKAKIFVLEQGANRAVQYS